MQEKTKKGAKKFLGGTKGNQKTSLYRGGEDQNGLWGWLRKRGIGSRMTCHGGGKKGERDNRKKERKTKVEKKKNVHPRGRNKN